MKQRIIFGAAGAILAISIIAFCDLYIIGMCVALLALIGLGEFYNVIGLWKKKSPSLFLGFLFCLINAFVVIKYPDRFMDFLPLSITAFVFLIMIFTVLFHDNTSFSDNAKFFLATLYITVFFLHIILVRGFEFGKFQIWLVFISAWATDTFAYFSGRFLGKHKLCPKISPKKTVEGAIGGTLGCVFAIVVYSYVCSLYLKCSVNYINACILSAIAAVISQIGDLAASCIKREHNVKDYGKIMPGHGGVLDRFDSVLLISPMIYYLIKYLPIFG